MKKKKTDRLPTRARRYVESLQASLRPSTCYLHRRTLKMWHRWADSTGVSLHAMTRDDVVSACNWLHKRGLQPSTRAGYLMILRGYLRYLFIHAKVSFHPDKIFHDADIPRIPERLPRALKPEVDAELQERLAKSDNPVWTGLLVMRRTGLRISELLSLPYDCTHDDGHGNTFLKVPLGKQYNERLVPIDNDTKALIHSIQQRMMPPPRPWLLQTRPGPHVCYYTIFRAMKKITKGLQEKEPQPITTHRFRHSYATELLNAGMSLASLQRLLGHRSVNMTLRYAKISLRSLASEYADAHAKMHERYHDSLPILASDDDETPVSALVSNAARRLGREAGDCTPRSRQHMLRIARRLKNAADQIAQLGL